MKTKPKREKKEPKYKKYLVITVGLFLISIMVLSVLQISGDEQKIDYNGYKFSKVDDGWLTYKNNNPVLVINNPFDLEDVSIDDVYFGSINKIYISYKDYIPANFNLIPFPVRPILATYDEKVSTAENIPLKDCVDADDNTLVIILQNGVQVSRFDQNCLIIQGDKDEMIQVVDKIILNLYGI